MRVKISKVNEIKCNFCSNWIIGDTLSRDTMNTCEDCLSKHRQNGCQVRTENGQTYRIVFLSQAEHHGKPTKKLIEEFQELSKPDVQETMHNWSRVRSIMQDYEGYNQDEGVKINEFNREYEQETELILDFIKNLNRTKSQGTLLSKLPEEEKDHSCYLKTEYNQQQTFCDSISSFKQLDDDSQSLSKTRFARRYQFYYDNDAIKQFKIGNSKKEREFGTQLEGLNNQDLFLNIRQNYVDKNKTNRSNTSFQSMPRNSRLSQEQLKSKISSFLQSKYQSTSLHRIMTSFVKQTYNRTNIQNKMMQLISFNISTMDLLCYLNLFDFDSINTIKLINVGLTDQQLPILVQFLWNKKVQRLVLSGNKLTENSLGVFLNRSLPYLREIYLGKNRINKYRVKQNIMELRGKFILYL